MNRFGISKKGNHQLDVFFWMVSHPTQIVPSQSNSLAEAALRKVFVTARGHLLGSPALGKARREIWVWVKIKPPGIGPRVFVDVSIYQVPFCTHF